MGTAAPTCYKVLQHVLTGCTTLSQLRSPRLNLVSGSAKHVIVEFFLVPVRPEVGNCRNFVGCTLPCGRSSFWGTFLSFFCTFWYSLPLWLSGQGMGIVDLSPGVSTSYYTTVTQAVWGQHLPGGLQIRAGVWQVVVLNWSSTHVVVHVQLSTWIIQIRNNSLKLSWSRGCEVKRLLPEIA